MVEIDEKFLGAFEAAIAEHERHGKLISEGAPLSRESGESVQRLDSFLGYGPLRAMIIEIRHLRELAYPPTEFRDDDDGGSTTCKECSYPVDEDGDPHTYRDDCIPNIQATGDYVHAHVSDEVERVEGINKRLLDGFARWKRGDLDTEEFEGLFYELMVEPWCLPCPAQAKAP